MNAIALSPPVIGAVTSQPAPLPQGQGQGHVLPYSPTAVMSQSFLAEYARTFIQSPLMGASSIGGSNPYVSALKCFPYESSMGSYPYFNGLQTFDPNRRKNATRESTQTLKAWLSEHMKNPYPTKGEKIMLAIITKMTLTQVSTWFANARRRLKKDNRLTWSRCSSRSSEADDNEDDFVDDSTVNNNSSSTSSNSNTNNNDNVLDSNRCRDDESSEISRRPSHFRGSEGGAAAVGRHSNSTDDEDDEELNGSDATDSRTSSLETNSSTSTEQRSSSKFKQNSSGSSSRHTSISSNTRYNSTIGLIMSDYSPRHQKNHFFFSLNQQQQQQTDNTSYWPTPCNHPTDADNIIQRPPADSVDLCHPHERNSQLDPFVHARKTHTSTIEFPLITLPLSQCHQYSANVSVPVTCQFSPPLVTNQLQRKPKIWSLADVATSTATIAT